MEYFANKTIVVPFDFSDESMKAVDKALRYAEQSTSVHVIHVIDPTPLIVSVDPAMPVLPSYDVDRHQQSSFQLEQKFGSGKYKRIKNHCSIGDPGSEIVELAKSLRADMIIMPSHGRRGISRLLLGSVAERVLRLANCPVLILRE